MGTHHPIRKTVPRESAPTEIPDKLYFRIGDVARLCEVPPYVLRFWETEFPQLKPNKGGTGQRLYRKRDVEMALRIKSLLYDEGYTIPGARQVFKAELKPAELKAADATEPARREAFPMQLAAPVQTAPEPASPTLSGLRRDTRLHDIRSELAALLTTLSSSPDTAARDAGASKVHAMRPRLAVEPIRSRQLSLEGELF